METLKAEFLEVPEMPVTDCSPGRPVFSTKAVGADGPRVPPGCRCSWRWVAPANSLCLVPQIGLFDLEVNCLTKILFGALVVVSLVMVALQHFAGRWYLQIIRFLLLFSNIIPIRYAENELALGVVIISSCYQLDPLLSDDQEQSGSSGV